MGSQKSVPTLSMRTWLIMIVVFIFSNVFALLMGIVIGRDDAKWQQGEAQPSSLATQSVPLNPRAEALEDAVNAFEEADDTELEDQEPEEMLTQTEADENLGSIQPPKVQDTFETPEQTDATQVARDDALEAAAQAKRDAEAKEAAQKAQEAQKAKEAPTREPAPKASTLKGHVFIQLVAAKDAGRAQALKKELESKGYSVFVAPEAGFHKVIIGPYPDQEEAKKDKKRLDADYKVNAWIHKRN